ncbi:MAG: hypothetical protein JWQ04_483 [Pedosphaera sp.]|nr:hypothetical protein [Pedosphaera sp.]
MGGARGKALFAGVSLLMLVFILGLVVPIGWHQGIPLPRSLALVLVMWLVSIFGVWVCLRSRRRRYTHGRARPTIGTDYSEIEDEELSRRE